MRVLISAGPTREYFDSVRFITNASSGRMGYALAEAARGAGHSVVLVSGPVDLGPPAGVERVSVVTAAEMFDACVERFERFKGRQAGEDAATCEDAAAFEGGERFEGGASFKGGEACDVCIMTAAVCDYRPARRLDQKLEKSDAVRTVELEPTRDICAHLGRIKGERILVGFAMEDHDAHARAEAKLRRKHCDAIVLNGLANVGTAEGEIEIFESGGGWSAPFSGTKRALADRVLAWVEARWRRRRGR